MQAAHSSQKTILVIDDKPTNRDSLRSLFTAAGFTVAEASDGLEALSLLYRGLRPCLIVLDLEMPVMDGEEFRRAQMAHSEYRAIPVVLFSAAPGLEQIAKRLQVAAYASKPADAAGLLALAWRHCLKADPSTLTSQLIV